MNIGIIGYGKMGAGIFRLLAGKPHDITVLMRSEEKAKDQENRFFRGLERSLRRGAITEHEYIRQKESLRFTHRLEDLASADLVTETAVENYREKADILRSLESLVGKNTVLVTNTSFISIAKLADELKYRERFCGLHFFYPVLLIDVVEIIKWSNTPAELVNFLKDFCEGIDKKPIVVNDGPGSVINIILGYCYLEALYLLEEGLALPSRIDELARRIFYIGPCESMDVVGVDLFLGVLERTVTSEGTSPGSWTRGSPTELLETATGGREGFFVPYLFGKLIAENRFGKRVSKGIYLYERDKPVDDGPEFYVNLARSHSLENDRNNEELIIMRLLYSIFSGSLSSLKRGMASREELDLGVREVQHMKEGPFTMMRAIGVEKLKEEFDFLTRNVGERFRQTSFDFF